MTQLSERIEVIKEPGKKPAGRWRNRYRATEIAEYEDGPTRAAGDVYWSHKTWPSKEIAEQKAIENMLGHVRAGYASDEYLGAFSLESDSQ